MRDARPAHRSYIRCPLLLNHAYGIVFPCARQCANGVVDRRDRFWWQRFRPRTVRLVDEAGGEEKELIYLPAQLAIERDEKSVLSTNNFRVIKRIPNGCWLVQPDRKPLRTERNAAEGPSDAVAGGQADEPRI